LTVPGDGACVYVVATPIGNLEDLSPRARRLLGEVSVIACEDTRRTGRLCARFGISTSRLSLHEHNEARRIPALLARLAAGASVALVSDAGTPLVSDPGARFVSAAIEAGYRVVPIPGPSAVLAALVASGLPSALFSFFGFLPRKGRARESRLADLRRAPGALVLFEAPGRVRETLRELRGALGERRVAVARELTKAFEEIVRGRLGDLEIEEPRGEVTIVVEAGEAAQPELPSEAEIDQLLEAGLTPRDAARQLALSRGISRSRAYALVLRRQTDR
jgi:16S rRNA (cytidine1402-2'-O)-methyltransferase